MLFVLSKVFWTLANPGALLALAAFFGLLGLAVPRERVRRLARRLLVVLAAAIVAVAVLPLDRLALTALEARFPAPAALPASVDGIVVLGGAIQLRRSIDRGAAQLNEYADRMVAAVALARRYPDARLVFTGGSSLVLDQAHREADYARQVFAALGLDQSRVVYESRSRNTHENATLTKRLVAPEPGETWLLVTSAFHMPRAVGVFRQAGWEGLIPYPVDYLTGGWEVAWRPRFSLTASLRGLSLAFHEGIGLLAYRLLGRTDSLYPGPGDAPPRSSG